MTLLHDISWRSSNMGGGILSQTGCHPIRLSLIENQQSRFRESV